MGMNFYTIKEAIKATTAPEGFLFCIYVDKNGEETWFFNGKPSYLPDKKK